MERASPAVAQHAAEVAGALAPHTAELSVDIYQLIVRDIPQLRSDHRILALLEASVAENVATVLHILQHGIDLDNVHAPAAAEEYARRLAQRGIPMAALLRAYRIGSTRFQHWCLQELAQQTHDAAIVSAAGLGIAETTAAYIDRISEQLVAAYETEKEHWLRNSARPEPPASGPCCKATRSTWMPPRPCWATGSASTTSAWWAGSTTPNQAAACSHDWNRRPWSWQVRRTAKGCRSLFPRTSPAPGPGSRSAPGTASPFGPCSGADLGTRFALGAPGAGLAGFRRTHRQALGAPAVALAAGPSGQRLTSFAEVAPLALMASSVELPAWVHETLGPLATDDDHYARLRDTLRVFLQENGSFKATAERLILHKNSVQYRVRKAEDALGYPVGERRLQVELALLASQWLGPAVLHRPEEPQP